MIAATAEEKLTELGLLSKGRRTRRGRGTAAMPAIDDPDAIVPELAEVRDVPASDKVTVPLIKVEDLIESNSADLILQGKIKKPVEIDGRLFICTGTVGTGAGGAETVSFHEVVPREKYHGMVIDAKSAAERQMRGYNKLLVKHGKVDYVLVDPERESPGHGFGANGKSGATGSASAETKRPKRETKPAPAEAQSTQSLISLPLEKLHDHPKNPVPSKEEVAEQVEWMRDGKQLEPLTVRPHPTVIGAYEVLSGRRRLAAAYKLKWDALECRVRDDFATAAEVVQFIFRVNADRHADTPIRQALGIQAMLGAGTSRKDAGAVYGLTSDGAITNKLGMLKLPDVWQQRVISGEVPETTARVVVPFADHPSLMAAIDESFRGQKWGWSRDRVGDTVKQVVVQSSRPLDGDDPHPYWHPIAGKSIRAVFAMLPAVETKLQIVNLPLGKNGKLVRRALNEELWDRLTIDVLNAVKQNQADRASKKGTGKASGTPSKADQKKRDADRAGCLEARIRGWRHTWLRQLVAQRIADNAANTERIVERMRVWLATHPFTGFSNLNAMELDERTINLADPLMKTKAVEHDDVWPAIRELDLERLYEISRDLVIHVLRVEDKDHKWPRLNWEHVDDLAGMAGIDLAAEWAELQNDRGSDVATMFELFLLHHDKQQLTELAAEWKISTEDGQTKKTIVAIILGQQRTLPLPSSIAPLPKPKRATPKRKK